LAKPLVRLKKRGFLDIRAPSKPNPEAYKVSEDFGGWKLTTEHHQPFGHIVFNLRKRSETSNFVSFYFLHFYFL
jgi:hypothetical protein